MSSHRLALRLLAYADACGVGDELIGDLQEEIADGRSRAWLCQQLLGVYGLAFARYLRARHSPTPLTFAAVLSLLLFAGGSVGSPVRVIETWLAFYAVTGTISLFAHMSWGTFGTRAAVVPPEADIR